MKMALTPKTNVSFETEEFDAAPTAERSTSTEVAVASPASQSVRAQFAAVTDTIGSLKDAMPVTYDMLVPLIVANGNVCRRSDKKSMGDEIVFELLSWQDSFVVSHKEEKGPKDLIKYSDDGVVCSDGTLVQEHLQELRNLGYAKAAVVQRLVVVGSVISASKSKELDDELVQFDLSPQSRTSFKNYAISAMNKQRLGRMTAEQVTKIKGTVVIATSGNNSFSKLEFTAAA